MSHGADCSSAAGQQSVGPMTFGEFSGDCDETR